ncbi:MAG: NAD(P)H-binding protein, partial [Gammaproteobacteria bacterium]|nr:NAD(P)H-binding protein [Gammaproteobacteria bacterium]
MKQLETVLVTGATGYIGGRLVGRLLNAGYRVRAVVRDPSRLQARPWTDQVEVVKGDLLDQDSLPDAMAGVDAAYYLIHSMREGADFQYRDLLAAHNFGVAAREAGLSRIIYLGGLGEPADSLSQHLSSRQQVGAVLRNSGVQVTEFRAAIIVGSGGISFEVIRQLTERLPVLLCPRLIYTRIQPIGLRNVLQYLVAALDIPKSDGEIVEIGGADVITYAEMFAEYAAQRGLRRRIIPVAVAPPRLFAHLVHFLTPVPLSIARPLIDGLRNEVVVRDDAALRLFPGIEPMTYRMSVQRALMRLDAHQVETTWSDAFVSSEQN